MTDNANKDLNDTTAPEDTEEQSSTNLSTLKWVGAGIVTAGAVLYAKDKVQGFRAHRAAKKAAAAETVPPATPES